MPSQNLNFTGGVIHIIDRVLSVPQNLTDTLSNANLTAAAGAIETADLAPAVGMLQNITVFAPDNAAFSDIGSVLANLSADALRSTLGYHVVENAVVYSADVMNSTLRAQNGDELNVYNINGTVFVNAARVTIPDLLISNGVVHVIDQYVFPLPEPPNLFIVANLCSQGLEPLQLDRHARCDCLERRTRILGRLERDLGCPVHQRRRHAHGDQPGANHWRIRLIDHQ